MYLGAGAFLFVSIYTLYYGGKKFIKRIRELEPSEKQKKRWRKKGLI